MTPAYKIFAYTILALLAFAANSILTRLALIEGEAGPWAFTLIRILAGALILALLIGPHKALQEGSWKGAIALLIYALFFSLAYLMLSTGTGALILFAAVQFAMLGWGYAKGERLSPLQWVGFILAMAGLIYLLSPGLEAPPLIGSVLMILAGFGWGAYSIIGKGAGNPSAQTAGNFIRAALLITVVVIPVFLLYEEPNISMKGWALALASGAITSGLGYVIWYSALKGLSATRAGLAQLSVPALAALGGVLFVSEPLTFRFVMACAIILCGVALSTLPRAKIKSS